MTVAKMCLLLHCAVVSGVLQVGRGELVTVMLILPTPFTAVKPVISLPSEIVDEWNPSIRSFLWQGAISNVRLLIRALFMQSVPCCQRRFSHCVQVAFQVNVAADATPDSYPCKARIVCGIRVMELDFSIAVTTQSGAMKVAAMAAAYMARSRKEGERMRACCAGGAMPMRICLWSCVVW